MKKKALLAGLILGAMLSLTAGGEATEQNIRENNEVQIGINLENSASELVEDMNEQYQNADDLLNNVDGQ